MKKIFTYPENSSTNYYTDSAASNHMDEIYDGNYLTNNLEDTPASASTVLQDWSKFVSYYEDRKHTTNLSRYDFWHYPLVTGSLEQISKQGWKLTNPKLAPGSGEAARLVTLDGSVHNMRNGMMINLDYGSGSDDALDESDYYDAVFLNVIDSTTVDVYTDCTFGDNAEPETFSTPVDPFFMMSIHQRDSATFQTTRIYDTFPRTVQSTNRDMFYSTSGNRPIKPIQDAIYAYDNNNSQFQNAVTNGNFNFEWFAPLLTGYYNVDGEDQFEARYMLALDDEWASLHVNPAEGCISSDLIVTPGGDPTSAYPSYTHTYSATCADGGTTITQTGHGFVNGDVVNVTSIKGGFMSSRDTNFNNMHRGGTGNVYFVNRLTDDHYELTVLPYRSNAPTKGTMKCVAENNKQYDWDSDTTETITITSTISLSVRKGQTLDTNYQLHVIEDVIRPVTDSGGVGFTHHYRNSGSGTFSTSAFIEDDRLSINPNRGEPLPYRLNSVEVSWPGNATFDTLTVSPNSWYVEGLKQPVIADVGRGSSSRGGRTRTANIPTIAVTTANNKVSGVSFSGDNYWPWSYNGRDTSGNIGDPIYGDNDNDTAVDSTHAQQSANYKIAFILGGYTTPATIATPGLQIAHKLFESSDWNASNYTETEAGDWYWPDHIAPRTATMNITQASSTNLSNSGIKYVRSSGVVKYQIDLEYPSMRQEDFSRFMAAVQAARGQLRPFRFPLRYISRFELGHKGILFQNPRTPHAPGTQPRLYAALGDGAKQIYLEGFGSEEDIAVYPGQHFRIDDSNRNGGLHMNVLQQKSNIYGQVIANLAYPVELSSSIAKGTLVEDQPEYCMVTINDDEFQYTTDYSGLYNFSIQMTLDERKD